MNELLMTWLTGTILTKLAFLGIAILINLVLGTLVAIRDKNFRWEDLPNFLLTALIFVVAWFGAELITFAPKYFSLTLPNELTTLMTELSGTGVFVFVVLKYLASILGHVGALKEVPVFTRIGIPPKVSKK